MKFLLDENVSPLVGEALQSMGHTILRLASGTKDLDLIASAQKEKASIISHDKDFLTLPSSGTEGVVLLRIHPPWAQDINASLKNFLSKTAPADWKGKLVLLEKDGFHIRF